MRDAENNLIIVSTDGTAGPYICVPVDRLVEVMNALNEEGIACSSNNSAICLNDQPSMGVINLGIGADVQAAQEVLDDLDC